MDKLLDLVGVTFGPKRRNVVLESKYKAPKIVNDAITRWSWKIRLKTLV